MLKIRNIFKSPFFVFFLVISIGALISISLTGRQQALQSDATDYFKLASEMSQSGINLVGLITQKTFVDIGYPFVLSLIMRVFKDNITVYQSANFVFWFLATVFIYKSLSYISGKKRAFYGALIMSSSPIFLTFPAKLYSEPFAALGVAMIIYFLISYKTSKAYSDLAGLILGTVIFSFTRSIFVLLAVFSMFLTLTRKNLTEYSILAAGILVLMVRFYFSYAGGRSDYNLAIQVSRMNQPYSIIGICSTYYLSIPVGKFIFPKSEATCTQGYPFSYIENFSGNPYFLASKLRGDFNLGKWFTAVLSNPFKYLVVVVSSMTGLIFIEGFYANITLHFSSTPSLFLFAIVKLVFAYYIWSGIYRNVRRFYKFGLDKAFLVVLPLVYFFVVVGNYPVEQRYLYPLMPWAYFLASLDQVSVEKIIRIFTNKGN